MNNMSKPDLKPEEIQLIWEWLVENREVKANFTCERIKFLTENVADFIACYFENAGAIHQISL